MENLENLKVKKFHVFISYRVVTDAGLAEKFCDKLQQLEIEREPGLRIKCFLDKQDLKFGDNWEEGFLSGLYSSCLFLPLFSEASLQYLVDSRPGVKDNCMLEYEKALKLQAEDRMDILPVFVGSVHSGVYKKFGGFGFKLPDHATATNPNGTIRETMNAMFKLQGIFLNPEELKDKLSVVQHRLSTTTWPRFRSDWAHLADLGPERKYNCVQCGEEYQESQNGEGHCSYHSTYHSGYSEIYACCQQKYNPPPLHALSPVSAPKPGQPFRPPVMQEIPGAREARARYKVPGCQRGRHRHEHHYDYGYEKWYDYVAAFTNYSDTRDVWLELKAENASSASSVFVEVGVITKGLDKGKLYINTSGNDRQFFKVYDNKAIGDVEVLAVAKTLRNASRVAEGKEAEPIVTIEGQSFKNNVGTASFVWDLEGEKVCGATFTLTTPTSQSPTVGKIVFTLDPELTKISSQVISTGGLSEAAPATPYVLPTLPWRQGEIIEPLETRAPQEFKSYGDLPGRFKVSKIVCNDFNSTGADIFGVTITFVNLDSANAVTLLEAAVDYAHLDGSNAEPTWTPVSSLTANTIEANEKTKNTLPQKVEASAVLNLFLTARVNLADLPKATATYNYSALARDGPVLLRIKVESADGRSLFLPVEWVNRRQLYEQEKEEGLTTIYLDHKPSHQFQTVSVKINNLSGELSYTCQNSAFNFDVKQFRMYAFKVLNKSQQQQQQSKSEDEDESTNNVVTPATELVKKLNLDNELYYRVANASSEKGDFAFEFGFLVDPVCRRVVAAQVVGTTPTASVVQFVPLPIYGDKQNVLETPHFQSALPIPDGYKELGFPAPRKIVPAKPLPWLDAIAASFKPVYPGAAPVQVAVAPTPVVVAAPVATPAVATEDLIPKLEVVFAKLLEDRLAPLNSRLAEMEAKLSLRLEQLAAKMEPVAKQPAIVAATPKPSQIVSEKPSQPQAEPSTASASPPPAVSNTTPIRPAAGAFANAASIFNKGSAPPLPGTKPTLPATSTTKNFRP